MRASRSRTKSVPEKKEEENMKPRTRSSVRKTGTKTSEPVPVTSLPPISKKKSKVRPVPDFSKMHDKWNNKLERAKAYTKKPCTVVEEFGLTRSAKKYSKETSESDNIPVLNSDERIEKSQKHSSSDEDSTKLQDDVFERDETALQSILDNTGVEFAQPKTPNRVTFAGAGNSMRTPNNGTLQVKPSTDFRRSIYYTGPKQSFKETCTEYTRRMTSRLTVDNNTNKVTLGEQKKVTINDQPQIQSIKQGFSTFSPRFMQQAKGVPQRGSIYHKYNQGSTPQGLSASARSSRCNKQAQRVPVNNTKSPAVRLYKSAEKKATWKDVLSVGQVTEKVDKVATILDFEDTENSANAEIKALEEAEKKLEREIAAREVLQREIAAREVLSTKKPARLPFGVLSEQDIQKRSIYFEDSPYSSPKHKSLGKVKKSDGLSPRNGRKHPYSPKGGMSPLRSPGFKSGKTSPVEYLLEDTSFMSPPRHLTEPQVWRASVVSHSPSNRIGSPLSKGKSKGQLSPLVKWDDEDKENITPKSSRKQKTFIRDQSPLSRKTRSDSPLDKKADANLAKGFNDMSIQDLNQTLCDSVMEMEQLNNVASELMETSVGQEESEEIMSQMDLIKQKQDELTRLQMRLQAQLSQRKARSARKVSRQREVADETDNVMSPSKRRRQLVYDDNSTAAIEQTGKNSKSSTQQKSPDLATTLATSPEVLANEPVLNTNGNKVLFSPGIYSPRSLMAGSAQLYTTNTCTTPIQTIMALRNVVPSPKPMHKNSADVSLNISIDESPPMMNTPHIQSTVMSNSNSHTKSVSSNSRSQTSIMSNAGSLSLRANLTPKPKSFVSASLEKGLALETVTRKYHEALLDEEVSLYASRLYVKSDIADRCQCKDPVAKVLNGGDETHFIPIKQGAVAFESLEGSAFSMFRHI